MGKSLKYERQLNWTMWGIIVICGGVMVYAMSQGFVDLVTTAGVSAGFSGGIHGLSSRVIKELKRENESLKSTNSPDPTPPGDK